MSDQPVFCILSTELRPPKEAIDLWKKHGEICGKPLFPYKGAMYSVYFPNVKALWRDGIPKNGYKVTWPMLRNDVEFTEIKPGLHQGVMKVAEKEVDV